MQNWVIKRLDEQQVAAMSKLIIANAQTKLKPIYTEAQFKAFTKYYAEDYLLKKIKHVHYYGAFSQNTLIGVVGLEASTVVGLYVGIDYIGLGIGKCLLQFIERTAIDMGLHQLNLAASPIAEQFYIKHNWQGVAYEVYHYADVAFKELYMIKNI